jgi:TonB-dependent receptor
MLNRGLFLFCSTSLAAVLTSPASAQETTTPQPEASVQQPKTTAAGQKKDAKTAQAAQEPAGSAIVVTGFRAALKSALETKRRSDAIVDVIMSEDVGKMPDNNGGEVLARLPGVQITRNNDEADSVLIRGLPNVTTTYNGRELFSTDDRQLHWQDFPASIAAGYAVYKSGTADLIEPGLGGLINIISRKPFDMKDVTIAGEIKENYNDQSKSWDPAGNLLIAHTWNTSLGEIGALLGGSYIRTNYRNALRYDGASVITPSSGGSTVATPGVGDFNYPDYIGNFYGAGRRVRPSVNGMLQWRPATNLEIYAEGLWSAYRGTVVNDSFGMSLRGGTLSNVVLTPGTDQAASLTHSGGNSPDIERQAMKDRTDLYQGAAGFNWSTGRAVLSGDFAYSASRYAWNRTHVDSQLATTPTINADFDVKGSGVFDLNGYDILNPDNYVWNALWQSVLVAKGDGWQGRLDLKYDTDVDWLPKLQFGVRGTTRTSVVHYGDRYAYVRPMNIPLASLPSGPLEVVKDGFRDDPQRLQNWLAPNGNAIIENSEALRQLTYNTLQQMLATIPWTRDYFSDEPALYATPDVKYSPTSEFLGKEKTLAGYAEGNYKFDLGSVQVDGSVGVRLAYTDGSSHGISRVVNTDGTIDLVPRTANQNWFDVLPSFQSRIRFTPDFQLRLAYTQTRSKPTFGQLNPGLNITRSTATSSNYQGYASGGNPDLKPLTSKNYDASLEYYFTKNGYASVAVFYHDLWGFIDNYTHDTVDPVYGLIQVTRPENAGKGRIKGVEANFQTFFNFLPGWLSGFGVQTNVTYLDAKNALPAAFGGQATMVPMINVSKWTYNLTGFYEKGPLSVRLSYNRRSHYVNQYNRLSNESQYVGEQTRAVARLDGSISYEFSKHLSFVGTATNILAQPFNDYRYYNQTQFYPSDLRIEGRYFSLGARFKF